MIPNQHRNRQQLEELKRLHNRITEIEGEIGYSPLNDNAHVVLADPHIQNDQKYKIIFEGTVVGIFYLDNDIKIIDVNPAFSEITNITYQEIVGKSGFYLAKKLLNDSQIKRFINSLKENRAINNTSPFEVEYFDKTIEFFTKKQDNGQFIGFIRDITERKREDLIKKIMFNISHIALVSENIKELIEKIKCELGRIIDTTNFYIVLYDQETGNLSLPYFEDEKDEFTTFPTGKTLTHYVIRTQKPLLANEERIIELEALGEVELYGTNSKLWLGVPLKIDGKVSGVMAIQSYEDSQAFKAEDLDILEFISSQISISIHKKNTQEVLEESKKRFKILSSVSFEGIIIHNNGIVKDINEACAQLFGYSVKELEGTNFIETLIAHVHHQVVFKKIKETISQPYEIIGIRKDGTMFPIEIEGRIISEHPEFGKTRVAAVRDISQRKQTELKLEKALEKASESERIKSAFLTTMSHELRTPLNAIIGLSEIIDEEFTLHEILECNKTIYGSGKHLLSLVEDIFDITLMETGYIHIEQKQEKIKAILDHIHGAILEEQQVSGKNQISINLITPEENESLSFYTDSSKFKQILLNLLKNALKFTSKGSINYGYTIGIEESKKCLNFFVKDTGIGISSENQKIIFEAFRQVEDSHTRAFGGAGIGLSISKKIIDLFGGCIWVESEEGLGSSFFFTLPLEAEINLTNNPNSKYTVLIVDDDQSSIELIRVKLASLNIETLSAKNGADAIDICKTASTIDLILMDINLPGMNGYDATIEIKKIRPNLPIIAQTAYPIQGDNKKAIAVGCDGYISKPIQTASLKSIIEEHLNTVIIQESSFEKKLFLDKEH